MEAYLDNSATTKVSNAVKEIVIKTMVEDFGNPSSMHLKGVEAERYLKQSALDIAKYLKVQEKEIIFTSGGTESNNLAIIGIAMANKRQGMHLITSAIEHPSVLNTMKYLEEQGFLVTYLKVNNNGYINIEDLENAITDSTILVSIMHVNNEIGSTNNIEEISKIIKKKNSKTIFHVDAIQSFGKYKIFPKKIGIDSLSVSGHKIHGPKGIGFLYVSEGIKIKPIIYGGGQQKGMRSGTDNVSGVAGIGQAVKEVYDKFEDKVAQMYLLKDYFIDNMLSIENVNVNSEKGKKSAPHIVSVSFLGVRSEVLLHSLEEKRIFVSSGSACSSNKQSVSNTLKNIGLSKDVLDSTIRFSLCENTSKEEIDYAIDSIKELLPKLRLYIRKK